MQIATCACGFDFIPTSARQCHCTPAHCKRYSCENAPIRRRIRTPEDHDGELADYERKCVACGRHARDFERFAPCDENCKEWTWYRSSKESADWPARFVFYTCHIFFDQPGYQERNHHPATEPRIHIKYCSLWCYNSPKYGHVITARQGNRVRQRRYISSSGRTGAYYRELAALRKAGD